jgi:hypothetical protein
MKSMKEIIIHLRDTPASPPPGMVKILLHDSYGGDGLPGYLADEYIKRMDLPTSCIGNEEYNECIGPLMCPFCRFVRGSEWRYDPICLEIMREASGAASLPASVGVGRKVKLFIESNAYSDEDSWRTQLVPEACKSYIRILEYDGKERLEINRFSILMDILERRRDNASVEILAEYNSIISRDI